MTHSKRKLLLCSAFLLSAASALLSIHGHAQRLFEGYFVGFLIVVSIPVGSIAVWLIHTLTGGAWGEPLRKYYVIFSGMLPAAFLIGIPNLFWLDRVFEWAQSPQIMPTGQAAYLNAPFFIMRLMIYFLVWFFCIRLLVCGRTQWAGFLTVIYILTGTFFAVDWVMSLDARWYSTIYGILFLTGQSLLAFCLMILTHVVTDNPGIDSGRDETRLRDQGNLLLTMVMFWAYLAFSQYLIIWMGNLPEEIRWYLPRVHGGWGIIAVVIIAAHFFVPFLLLLRRAWKQRPGFLAMVAGLIIAMRVVDIAWSVLPSWGRPLSHLTLTHLAAFILPVSAFILILDYRLRNVKWRD